MYKHYLINIETPSGLVWGIYETSDEEEAKRFFNGLSLPSESAKRIELFGTDEDVATYLTGDTIDFKECH